MIQNHFNIKRFYNALKFDLNINSKKYISFIISLFLVLLIFDLFFILQEYNRFNLQDYQPLFLLTFIIGLVIVVGTSFPLLRDKKSTINYLMLPASIFEKFLIQFVIRILCFMVLFVPVFWLDFKLADSIYNLFEWKNYVEIASFELFAPFKYKSISTIDLIATICGLFSIATFLFAGATYFSKKVLPKTFFSFALFVGLVFVSFVLGTFVFYPEKFHIVNQPVFVEDYKVSKDLYNAQLYCYVIAMVSSLFLLPLSYFKLKEKEL